MIKEDISCEYIMHMGDDLNVVNNARVSFDKESGWKLDFSKDHKFGDNVLSDQDQGLIRFLATGFRNLNGTR
jgi:thymidylate synthase (FAD)